MLSVLFQSLIHVLQGGCLLTVCLSGQSGWEGNTCNMSLLTSITATVRKRKADVEFCVFQEKWTKDQFVEVNYLSRLLA